MKFAYDFPVRQVSHFGRIAFGSVILFAAVSLSAKDQIRPADIHAKPEKSNASSAKSTGERPQLSVTERPNTGRSDSVAKTVARHAQAGAELFPDRKPKRLISHGRSNTGNSSSSSSHRSGNENIPVRQSPQTAHFDWP